MIRHVTRQDLDDRIVVIAWWQGIIPAMRNYDRNTLALAPVPFNVLIGWCVRARRWAKYPPITKQQETDAHAFSAGWNAGIKSERLAWTERMTSTNAYAEGYRNACRDVHEALESGDERPMQ